MSFVYIMNNTLITDIFGNKLVKHNIVNGNLPFIIIQSTQPYILLTQVATLGGTSIWRLKKDILEHTLYYHSIIPSKFSPLGDFWLPLPGLVNTFSFLLVNTGAEISEVPFDFIKIDQMDTYGVWKPVGSDDKKEMGLILSETKPPLTSTRLVDVNFLRKYNIVDNVLGRITNMNEFNLLGHLSFDRFTINRPALLTNEMNIRLINRSSGNVISDDDVLRLRRSGNADYQQIRYGPQGELMMSNKCIGVENNNVVLQKCGDSDSQKWYPYRDTFISHFDRSCLTDDGGVLKALPCADVPQQKWLMEDLKIVAEPIQERRTPWKTRMGKSVILVEPDNPWYINKVDREPEGYIEQSMKILDDTPYEDDAIYDTPRDPKITPKKASVKSNFMMNTKRPDMGYGYAVNQRSGRPCVCADDCDKVEHFEGEEKKGTRKGRLLYVCSSIIVVVVIILLLRRYYK
jgi:hypothetical protein